MTRRTIMLAAVLAAVAGCARVPPETARNFVSCPIVRDTATVPCWLAEHDGETYYLGIQTDISADFDPPYLGHQVLVEGTVSDEPRICGGKVLKPVSVSPMPERDLSCNTILPAVHEYTVPFAPRPPGPSGGRLAFQAPPPNPRDLEPPFEERAFVIYYDFEGMVMGRDAGTLSEVLRYATTAKATRVTVAGRRGASLLSNRTTMLERAEIADARTREVVELLQGGGLTMPIEAQPQPDAERADGVEDWKSRRTTITVHP
jgi:hypothetical protein